MLTHDLLQPDSGVEPYWDTLRKAEGMRDVFAVQFCPPLDSSDSGSGQDQGGQLVSLACNNLASYVTN